MAAVVSSLLLLASLLEGGGWGDLYYIVGIIGVIFVIWRHFTRQRDEWVRWSAEMNGKLDSIEKRIGSIEDSLESSDQE